MSKGVKIAKRKNQDQDTHTEEPLSPPTDIYESVVRARGFDPLKERAARRE